MNRWICVSTISILLAAVCFCGRGNPAGREGTQETRTPRPKAAPAARAAHGLSAIGAVAQGLGAVAPDKPPRRALPVDDITDKVRQWNSPPFARPPSSFRKISVSARTLPQSRIRKRPDGFEILLPAGASVVSPAVHDGAVFVSGGFRSKQFFALHASTGQLRWGAELGDDGPSTPACDEDICVFNTESCTVFGLDVKTGRLRWSWYLGDPQLSAPTIARGRVFTSYPTHGRSWGLKGERSSLPGAQRRAPLGPRPPGMAHALLALDLKTGAPLWQHWIDADVMSAPVAVGTELYVTTFAGSVYKFDQATGRILAAERARATSAPVVVGSDVLYTQREDQVAPPGGASVAPRPVEYIAKTGRQTFRGKQLYQGKGASYLNERVQRRTQYHGKGLSDDAANGFTGGAPASAKAGVAAKLVGLGTVSNLQAFQGSRLLVSQGRTYASMGDEVVATETSSGKKLWSRKLPGDMRRMGGHLAAPPAMAGGQIFVATLGGTILQLDPRTGEIAKTYTVGHPVRSQPVIHEGWLYVGTENGRLVAIDTRNRLLTGWAQWGGDAARSGVR